MHFGVGVSYSCEPGGSLKCFEGKVSPKRRCPGIYIKEMEGNPPPNHSSGPTCSSAIAVLTNHHNIVTGTRQVYYLIVL